MFETLLIPLDGSDRAAAVIPMALRIAKKTNARVIMLRAVEPQNVFVPELTGVGIPPEVSDQVRVERAQTYLDEIYDHYAGRGVPIETMTRRSTAAGAIIDVSEEEGADLIIMGTHGYSGVERWLLGSVTERVLRYASCPVLALRDGKIPERMLISLDGSTLSEAVLPVAVTLAQLFDMSLALVRATDLTQQPDWSAIKEISYIDDGLAERLKSDFYQRSQQYLNEWYERLQREGIDVVLFPYQGTAAEVILASAEDFGADLIAMSTHGRSGIQRWRYGSVTEKVLRRSDKGMLIVRPEALRSN